MFFFFSSRRRHTRCALVTGVQTCALPISACRRADGQGVQVIAAVPGKMSNMENFTIEIDADGIALVTFDVPGRSMNAISASVQRDLDVLVAAIKSDDSIRAMVLQSGKESGRSEEHTSELQSIMRSSYAVFCLKKKKKKKPI